MTLGISIHMPHTWHDDTVISALSMQPISIHMPHTWHDLHYHVNQPPHLISIHMPHTWHDVLSSSRKFLISYFNPHATYVA